MAKRKKGVSAEEKQVRILSIFSESQSVFNLKEVEKLGAKKGVVQQTIKDINQLLVDDGKVDTDKIGSGNFYWSFASKQTQSVNGELSKLTADAAGKEAELATAAARKAELLETRQPSEQRDADVQKLRVLKKRKRDVQNRLDELRENDPALLDEMREQNKMLLEGANRWTDNIFCIKDHVVKKKGYMDSKEFDKWFELSSNFDYLT